MEVPNPWYVAWARPGISERHPIHGPTDKSTHFSHRSPLVLRAIPTTAMARSSGRAKPSKAGSRTEDPGSPDTSTVHLMFVVGSIQNSQFTPGIYVAVELRTVGRLVGLLSFPMIHFVVYWSFWEAKCVTGCMRVEDLTRYVLHTRGDFQREREMCTKGTIVKFCAVSISTVMVV